MCEVQRLVKSCWQLLWWRHTSHRHSITPVSAWKVSDINTSRLLEGSLVQCRPLMNKKMSSFNANVFFFICAHEVKHIWELWLVFTLVQQLIFFTVLLVCLTAAGRCSGVESLNSCWPGTEWVYASDKDGRQGTARSSDRRDFRVCAPVWHKDTSLSETTKLLCLV